MNKIPGREKQSNQFLFGKNGKGQLKKRFGK
jgi:hypothetical protein